MGIDYNMTQQPLAAWLTLIAMDVWHWTSLVALLAYAGLIAILLRFMDSFMIYTEAIVLTGGGPGNATTLLSIDLVKMALGQFDLGPAAAMSIIYFLITLAVSWVFYTLMTRHDAK
jgi:glycerol transport system permease protein